MVVSVFVEVEGASFDLERFDLADGKGEIWENAGPEKRAHLITWGFQERKQSWYQEFEIRTAEDVKSLRVRMKYGTGVKMVNVPVDDMIGPGGPVPQKTAGKCRETSGLPAFRVFPYGMVAA
ncbi:MAG: hypothetical protein LUE13_04065 [Akkermansiaceae bacterium]|nr:hypothetical protein [Akkermansiaceae bacterium]